MRWMLSLLIVGCLSGCGVPSLLITPVPNVTELKEITVKPGKGWSPKKVAIIEVEGMLLNMQTGGLLQPTENNVSRFVEQLERAEEDPKVVAVVLRVNSPGGTVTASDTMYQELVSFRQRSGKYVVASTQEVAASGAYMVACGADRIVVHPTSVVGSIGVIFNAFDFEGTLRKLGIRFDPVQSGPFKDMGSMFRPRRDEETKLMQAMVDEFHQRFVAVVRDRRKITDPLRLAQVTDGRVFTGMQAVELGLADHAGLLEDAIAQASEAAGAKDPRVIMYKRPYGYRGSIYASTNAPQPQTNAIQLNVPALNEVLPMGFYYLWRP